MAEEMPVCRRVLRAGHWSGANGTITLSYEARVLRRKRLEADGGSGFLADLPEAIALGHGDAFELEDGRRIAVLAANEPLLAVRGPLARLAWHIGNRHTPCQIEADRLLIRRDHVLRDMLLRLEAEVADVVEPFTPEGGAYGHGRTLGHGHGHAHQPGDRHEHA
jgi:urease accessory protein